MSASKVSFVHFSFFGGRSSVLPGAERVMMTQFNLLKDEMEVGFIVGGTDQTGDHIKVYPEINSGCYVDEEIADTIVEEITAELLRLKGRGGLIAHNTTNAYSHNRALGLAIPKVIDRCLGNGCGEAAIFVHDARKAGPDIIPYYLPQKNGARLICISELRKRQLLTLFDEVVSLGNSLPDFDIRVISNPIDPIFFNPEVDSPKSIDDFFPNFFDFLPEWGGLSKKDGLLRRINELFFEERKDETLIFCCPARIVKQKNPIETIEVMLEMAKGHRNNNFVLLITAPPDVRKTENLQYWKRVKRRIANINGGEKNLDIILLGGVEWKYMPWLYRQCKCLILLSENEGFSLTPIEAALCGLPAAISDDPAMCETSAGYACTSSISDIRNNPNWVGKNIMRYLSSHNKDTIKLSNHAEINYAPDIIKEKLIDII